MRVYNIHLASYRLDEEDRDEIDRIKHGDMSENSKKTIKKFKNTVLEHEKEVDMLISHVEKSAHKTIMCGDFNDTPFSYAQRTIMGTDMTDVYKECAFGPTITFHANRFYFRIDHMLYKGRNLEAVDIERGDIKYSDHYPLVATFKIH